MVKQDTLHVAWYVPVCWKQEGIHAPCVDFLLIVSFSNFGLDLGKMMCVNTAFIAIKKTCEYNNVMSKVAFIKLLNSRDHAE